MSGAVHQPRDIQHDDAAEHVRGEKRIHPGFLPPEHRNDRWN